MKEKYDVDGMTCASCVAHVEKAVSKLDGVSSVEVSLVSNSMIVDYDSNKVNSSSIEDAVSKAGYKASIYEEKKAKEEKFKRDVALKVRKRKLWASIIILAVLMVFSMWHMLAMEYSWPFVTDYIEDIGLRTIVVILIELVLTVPIIVINFSYFTRGFKALFNLHPNMDSLIALGSSVSFIYGLYIFIKAIVLYLSKSNADYMSMMNQIYIESSSTILVFVSIGKYLENKATNKTKEAISKLASLTPSTFILYKNNKEEEKDILEAKIGDVAVVKPGERVPADGTIIFGYGNIDESMITGEELPKYLTLGNKVVAGTINKEGSFRMSIEKLGKDTAVSNIAKLVEEASMSKTPLSKTADKISLVFVPAVISISIIVFLVWLFYSSYNVDKALEYAISVLVVSCPCALGLATPIAITAGSGKGAERGILFKSGEAFERLAKGDVFVFDKTGTLTKGKMEVKDFILYDKFDKVEALMIASSIEKMSEHPLSKAVVEYASNNKVEIEDCSSFKSYPGKGVSGINDKKEYYIGNRALLIEVRNNISSSIESDYEKMSSDGETVLFFFTSDKVIGLIGISDSLKDDSYSAIKELQHDGKKTMMLTGDNRFAAKRIADELGLDSYKYEVVPSEKEKYIKELQNKGQVVVMVGDGINDAPSLMQADVGIAVGSGTDIAISSADVIIMRSSISDVSYAYELSKKTVRTIHMNLFWAFFYNVIMIPIAAGSLTALNFVLSPMLASLAMSLSSVTVVLNSLRLRFFNKKEDTDMLFKSKKVEGVQQVLSIDGMMCEHCANHVSEALKSLNGVSSVKVDLKKGKATIVSNSGIKDDDLSKAITDAGYVLTGVETK